MDTSNGAAMPASQYASVPARSMTGVTAPTMNYAMAFQPYQNPFFNQQLLLQQPPVSMSSLSIEAAAKQAAARAAEISKILEGENDVEPKEKMEESAIKRESFISKPRSQLPSSKSKSESESPVRYRRSRGEHDKYSPKESGRYKSYKHSGYYIRGYHGKDYDRSGYRRSDDYYHGRDYSYHHRGSRGGRKSHSRSRYLRYRHGWSRSPRYRRSRSPSSDHKIARDLTKDTSSVSPVKSGSTSSKSDHKISPRDSNRYIASRSPVKNDSTGSRSDHKTFSGELKRHSTSWSPINSRSTSLKSDCKISASERERPSSSRSLVKSSRTRPSSSHSVSLGPKKSVDRRYLSSSRYTQDGSLSSLSVRDSRGAKYHSNDQSNSGTKSEGSIEHMPSNKHLKKGGISRSSPSLESTPVDHSGPNFKRAASTSRSPSNYSRSLEKGSSPGASGPTNNRNDPAVSSPQMSTDDTDNSLRKVDHQLLKDDEDVDGRHDDMVIMRGERPKPSDSVSEIKVKQNSIKSSSSNSHSLSLRGSHLEKGSWENAYDDGKVCTDNVKCKSNKMHQSGEAEEESSKIQKKLASDLPRKAKSSNKDLSYPPDLVIDNKSKFNVDNKKWSEDMVIEIFVNNHDCSIVEADSHHHEHQSIHNEVAALSLPKVSKDMVDNMMQVNCDKLKQEPEYHIRTPVRLPGVPWVETAEGMGSPLLYCYPEERPKGSPRSRENRRKHAKRHHKRHRRDESGEDEEYRRENEREQKPRERRSSRRMHHRKGSERSKKWKHLSTSDSYKAASSSDNDDYDNFPGKRSIGPRKRKQSSPSTTTTSSSSD